MRRGVLVGLIAWIAAPGASAHAVKIMLPQVVTKCSSLPAWPDVERCVAQYGLGQPTVTRQLDGAKLLEAEKDNRHGVYLYVHDARAWQLAGFYEPSGEAVVLGMQAVTVGARGGYRIDIGELTRTAVSPDGATFVPAVMRERSSLFCTTGEWRCTAIVTACDILVRGQTQWTFRGSLAIRNGKVIVTGDRHLSGGSCDAPEEFDLGW